jgi:hypothetical protein
MGDMQALLCVLVLAFFAVMRRKEPSRSFVAQPSRSVQRKRPFEARSLRCRHPILPAAAINRARDDVIATAAIRRPNGSHFEHLIPLASTSTSDITQPDYENAERRIRALFAAILREKIAPRA